MSTALQKNLRHQIEEKKISVHSLEKRAGLKPSAIQNILRGKSKRPAAELLFAIAKELDCSVEQLIQEEKNFLTPQAEVAKQWHPDLFKDSLEKVQLNLSHMGLDLSKDEVLKIVDEVYLYSIKGSCTEADSRFVDWLINRLYPQTTSRN
jgi:transcriptional regulator with XRE-family HTH domain